MNKTIKKLTIFSLISLGSILSINQNYADASKVSTIPNESASKEYAKEGNENVPGVVKLMGHKRKYGMYKFVLKKKINAYYMHYSKYGNGYNKITGKTTLKRGTVVYAYIGALSPAIMSTDGVVWHTIDKNKKLPKDFLLATVMTNKNARIANGNYHKIVKEARHAFTTNN